MADDLERRARLLVDRLGFVPTPADQPFLEQVPYWQRLLEAANPHGGLFSILGRAVPPEYLHPVPVEIPSLEQRVVGATIARRRKALELSKPGTRKTIATLCALVPISQELGYLPKTFITCPGYIVPAWIREIERLFPDPAIVVVTRENRERAVLRAAEASAQFVLVGYDMTFRNVVPSTGGSAPPGFSERYLELVLSLPTADAIYERLRGVIGRKKTETIARRNLPLPKLISHLAEQEALRQHADEAGKVLASLSQSAFAAGTPFYAIVDEYHNIVHHGTKRGQAIAKLARDAAWLALISGTGIGSTPENLSWSAHVLGFVDAPEDFAHYIRSDTQKKVRAFIDLYGVHPVRTLREIDGAVKDPIVVDKPYALSDGELALFSALLDSDLFDGRQRYTLFRYLIANPHKLLPERFAHLAGGDDPLSGRIQEFYAKHPGLEDRVRAAARSRIDHVVALVADIKAMGEKCLVACEYQRDVTDELEGALSALGARRIDQTVSAELPELRLTEEERQYLAYRAQALNDAALFSGAEVWRSDLGARAKGELRIRPYEVYGLSERDRVMHEFATDPEIPALVSTRVLREGVELKEARYIIVFEDTTVPWKHEQFNGRTIRSGQHRQTYIWRVRAPTLALLEQYLEDTRGRRQQVIDMIFHEGGANPDEVAQWLEGDTDAKRLAGPFRDFNIRSVLGFHFNWLEGAGPVAYSRALQEGNNAMFIAELYTTNWETSHSGNIARLTRDIVRGIETRKSVSLERILEAACGPFALGRGLGRPLVGVDMNRHMLEHGLDACEEAGVDAQALLGDITDLRTLVEFDDRTVSVFEPGKAYRNTRGIPDRSQDLVVASLVFDLLDPQGRYLFLREAHRVLDADKYLVIIIPTQKIDPAYRGALVADIEACGFRNMDYFTGTYEGFRGRQQEGVDGYVVVAQKGAAHPADAAPALSLRPPVRIIETGGVKGERRAAVGPAHIHADYFVKVESGLDLTRIDPEPPTYQEEAKRLAGDSTDDEIGEVLRRITHIVEEGT